ncbi:hypothetical protein CEUSTIGMA_g5409.t1 [Chlamydomonas eustigma]|uniref:Uncharacterized protein n=1 Tax=Chlamydomonas eustigma TaxID=1157962 RepID=A0A250X4F5_9CHLO|nr:hypothetical protein CEUSTIGMA_g5409.t1 [Chlamydomonas eustigma]|eukprot:GAX77967.1 hypothetical protein CEUSTIGMA_g5409.t1 [Chlamydomonas eustigma]
MLVHTAQAGRSGLSYCGFPILVNTAWQITVPPHCLRTGLNVTTKRKQGVMPMTQKNARRRRKVHLHSSGGQHPDSQTQSNVQGYRETSESGMSPQTAKDDAAVGVGDMSINLLHSRWDQSISSATDLKGEALLSHMRSESLARLSLQQVMLDMQKKSAEEQYNMALELEQLKQERAQTGERSERLLTTLHMMEARNAKLQAESAAMQDTQAAMEQARAAILHERSVLQAELLQLKQQQQEEVRLDQSKIQDLEARLSTADLAMQLAQEVTQEASNAKADLAAQLASTVQALQSMKQQWQESVERSNQRCTELTQQLAESTAMVAALHLELDRLKEKLIQQQQAPEPSAMTTVTPTSSQDSTLRPNHMEDMQLEVRRVGADRDIIAMNYKSSVKQVMAMKRERDAAMESLIEARLQNAEALEGQEKMHSEVISLRNILATRDTALEAALQAVKHAESERLAAESNVERVELEKQKTEAELKAQLADKMKKLKLTEEVLQLRVAAKAVTKRDASGVNNAAIAFVNTNRYWVPENLIFDFVKSLAAREETLVTASGFVGMDVKQPETKIYEVSTQWASIAEWESWATSDVARRHHLPAGVMQYVPKKGEGFPEDSMPFKDATDAVNAKY